jgi:hypothetical protein
MTLAARSFGFVARGASQIRAFGGARDGSDLNHQTISTCCVVRLAEGVSVDPSATTTAPAVFALRAAVFELGAQFSEVHDTIDFSHGHKPHHACG